MSETSSHKKLLTRPLPYYALWVFYWLFALPLLAVFLAYFDRGNKGDIEYYWAAAFVVVVMFVVALILGALAEWMFPKKEA